MDGRRVSMTDAAVEHGPNPSGGQERPVRFELDRRGGRALVFHGRRRAGASTRADGRPFWHDVSIFDTVEGGIVLSIASMSASPDGGKRVSAWRCTSIDAALDRLFSYDATADIPVLVDPEDPDLSAAEMCAHALDLRAQIDVTRRAFAGLALEMAEALR